MRKTSRAPGRAVWNPSKGSGRRKLAIPRSTTHGVIQLTVDKSYKVWQVDMSVPGYACTIAPFPKDVETFLQSYRFDGTNLQLTSKGSYVCGKAFANVPDQTLGWDIKVDLPVFEKN